MDEDLIKGKIQHPVILPEDNNVKDLMNPTMIETGYLIEQFMYRSQSIVSAFIHPISGQLILGK